MADSGCDVCTRIILVFINILYLMISIGLIGIGVFFLVEEGTVSILVGKNLVAVAIAILIAGIALFITALSGIIGAVGNFWCLLATHCLFVLVFIGAEVVAGVLAFVFRGEIQDQVEAQLLVYIQNYTKSKTSSHYDKGGNSVIDFVQKTFKCCGLTGPWDWVLLNPTYVAAHGVPDSCKCDHNSTNHQCGTIIPNFHYRLWIQGCNETFYNFVQKNLLVLGGTTLSFAVIQFMAVLLSCGASICAYFDGNMRRRQCYRYRRLETSLVPSGNTIQEYIEEDDDDPVVV